MNFGDKKLDASYDRWKTQTPEEYFNHNESEEEQCELCNLSRTTKWYYEGRDWKILDCKKCNKPMLVYRPHKMFIPLKKLIYGLLLVRKLFGSKAKIRMFQRKIKNHYHAHIEIGDKDG